MFEMISKENVEVMLKKLILSKSDLVNFGNMMSNVSKEKQESILYLLYNEYITVDELENINQELADSIIQKYNSVLNTKYGHMKTYFVRDLITTLSLKNYKDLSNIQEQMQLVYDSLSDDEKAFINKSNEENVLMNYIRIENNDGILRAVIENSDNLSNTSDILNEIDSFGNISNDALLLKSILQKISMRTINY